MRKACIELLSETKVACLVAGELGTGRYLHMVMISEDMRQPATKEKWAKALSLCQQKAAELKYEVVRIRGGSLAGLPRS